MKDSSRFSDDDLARFVDLVDSRPHELHELPTLRITRLLNDAEADHQRTYPGRRMKELRKRTDALWRSNPPVQFETSDEDEEWESEPTLAQEHASLRPPFKACHVLADYAPDATPAFHGTQHWPVFRVIFNDEADRTYYEVAYDFQGAELDDVVQWAKQNRREMWFEVHAIVHGYVPIERLRDWMAVPWLVEAQPSTDWSSCIVYGPWPAQPQTGGRTDAATWPSKDELFAE